MIYDTTLEWLRWVVYSVDAVRAQAIPPRGGVVQVPGVGATEGAIGPVDL